MSAVEAFQEAHRRMARQMKRDGMEFYQACPHCYEEITRIPPDAIDYCRDCDVVTEGETITGEREI